MTTKNGKIKVDLRDYFIAAALTGLCANRTDYPVESEAFREEARMIAKRACKIADEIMLERFS
jgi:hypothetical protein